MFIILHNSQKYYIQMFLAILLIKQPFVSN